MADKLGDNMTAPGQRRGDDPMAYTHLEGVQNELLHNDCCNQCIPIILECFCINNNLVFFPTKFVVEQFSFVLYTNSIHLHNITYKTSILARHVFTILPKVV